MEPLLTDILYSGHLVKPNKIQLYAVPIVHVHVSQLCAILCSSPKCGHLAIPYSGQVVWSQQYLELYKLLSIMWTVGRKSPVTATRFSHLTLHHTAFSLISIVLVTSKALGAFSPTHSKPELQNRSHVVLKSPSACCHAYHKFNQKPLKYGRFHIPDTHMWCQWCPH